GLGNLLSSNADRCCPKVTIDGLLATVGVADGAEGPEVSHVTVTPTYNERRTFRVVPVADGLDFLAPGDPLAAELRRSWERTIGHVFRLDAMALGVAPDRTPRASAERSRQPVLIVRSGVDASRSWRRRPMRWCPENCSSASASPMRIRR